MPGPQSDHSSIASHVIVRELTPADWPAVWAVIEPVFRAGDTYPYPPDIDEEEARRIWCDTPQKTYVALDDDGAVLGTYYLKPNQPGQGSHICNAGFITSVASRGKGVARTMCAHSMDEARALGFRGMQFNFVVASNEGAIALWRKMGFEIVGRLPGVFRHPALGYVDAIVMFQALTENDGSGAD